MDFKHKPDRCTHTQTHTRAVLLAVILADKALAELVNHSAQHSAGVIGEVQIPDLHHGDRDDGESFLVLFSGTRP